MGAQVYRGILQLVMLFQMFVIGPRLILNVREYHASHLANSGEGINEMPTIFFQELIRVPSGNGA